MEPDGERKDENVICFRETDPNLDLDHLDPGSVCVDGSWSYSGGKLSRILI